MPRQLSVFMDVPPASVDLKPQAREPLTMAKPLRTGENLNVAASGAGQPPSSQMTSIQSDSNTSMDTFEDPIMITLILLLNNRTKRNTLENTMNPFGSIDKDTYGVPDYDKVLNLLNTYSATYGTAKGEGYNDPVISFLQAMTTKNTNYLSNVLSDSSGKPDFQKISNMVDAYSTYHPKQAVVLRDTAIRLLKTFFSQNKPLFASEIPIALDENSSLSQIVDELDDYVTSNPKQSVMLRDSFIKYLQDYANNNLTSLATVFSQMKRISSDVTDLPEDLKRRVDMLADIRQSSSLKAEAKGRFQNPLGAFVGSVGGLTNGFNERQVQDYGTPQIAAIGLNGELITDRKLIGRLVARKSVLYNDVE